MTCTIDVQAVNRESTCLRTVTGLLTQDLVLRPGRFRSGQSSGPAEARCNHHVVCGFCSTGCGLNVHLNERPGHQSHADSRLPGQSRHGVSERLGSAHAAGAPDRATTPLLRNEHGKLEPVNWDTAMQAFVERFKAIQDKHGTGFGRVARHRPDRHRRTGAARRAWRSSAWACVTAMATRASAWPRRPWPTSNPSASTRRRSPTPDFEESDVIVLVGSNLCIAHPIMWQRVLRNNNEPEIIVVDPRKTETAHGRHAALRAATQIRSDAALRPGAYPDRKRLDRSRVHRRSTRPASRQFDEFVRTVHARTSLRRKPG